MNDAARDALNRVIQNYGPSIGLTPRSCEMFVRQETAEFPQETNLLVAGLRHGVTESLLQYRPTEPWDPLAGELQQRLRKQAGLTPEEGEWVVDAWARALGRHPEAAAVADEVRPAVVTPRTTVSSGTIHAAMTLIVAAGGASGGALGSMLVPGILLVTSAATAMPHTEYLGSGMEKWLIVTIALLIYAGIGGIGGAIGAALGWRYGKGDTRPWTGFGAAFGAAFTTSALTGWFCGIFGWFFGSLFGAFGAATTCARRGGWNM
jgi:hypothetical protein